MEKGRESSRTAEEVGESSRKFEEVGEGSRRLEEGGESWRTFEKKQERVGEGRGSWRKSEKVGEGPGGPLGRRPPGPSEVRTIRDFPHAADQYAASCSIEW